MKIAPDPDEADGHTQTAAASTAVTLTVLVKTFRAFTRALLMHICSIIPLILKEWGRDYYRNPEIVRCRTVILQSVGTPDIRSASPGAVSQATSNYHRDSCVAAD